MPRLSAARAGTTCNRLSFPPSMCPGEASKLSQVTAHPELSLIKNVDLPLTGSREELNFMDLSGSIT